jgi:hypothetical protein
LACPSEAAFASWAWLSSGTPITGATGTNSYVASYVVHHAGDYSLSLFDGFNTGNDDCTDTSATVHISAATICYQKCYFTVLANYAYDCTGHGVYPDTIYMVGLSGGTATYTVTSPSGTFTGLSPAILTAGLNTINGTFVANSGVAGSVLMTFTMIDSIGQVCQDTVYFTLPYCTKELVVTQPTGNATATDTMTAKVMASDFRLLLMPNPATDKVDVIYSTGPTNDPLPKGETLELDITDEQGQDISTQVLASISGEVVLDVSTFVPGTYFISLRKNHAIVATDKLVVMSK